MRPGPVAGGPQGLPRQPIRTAAHESRPPGTTASPFAGLPPLTIREINSQKTERLRLYDAFGQLDPSATAALDSLLGDHRKPKQPLSRTMDRRLLKLVFRTAYHFGKYELEIISGYRRSKRRHQSPHAQGRAVDFRLVGVKPQALASYLRGLPRVGVGVYLHPRTQYVHLDVRSESYHWLDSSPPRRHWRGQRLPSAGTIQRDTSYTEAMDLPEGMGTPVP